MILWIDDDRKSALQAFYDELADAGYKIIMAKNPQEALDKLESYSEEISCIIMDMMLPTSGIVDNSESLQGTKTGVLLVNLLKSSEEYRNIPIIVLTITKKTEIYQWAESSGITLLLKQSIYPDELLDEVLKMGIDKDVIDG